jgi:hypothetical protein
MNKIKKIGFGLAFILLAWFVAGSYTDEGMWLLNNVPKKYLQEKYGFTVTDAWLEHLQKSVVRFPNGTGSFISSEGLVLTNHHIASEWLQKLSTQKNNYYENGFLAATRAQELKCPGLELVVLMSIEDVTERIYAGESIASIGKESTTTMKFFGKVEVFYNGGQYHLYRYRRYNDVRLVFAPENAVGFFGGDADNFEYPRYNLDCALFRAYENDKPAKIEHFLKWNKAGTTEDELIFVVGNPGSTYRLQTVAGLEFMRDVSLPLILNYLRRSEILCQQFAYEGSEEERIVADELFSIQNSRKAYYGMLKGLQDPKLMAEKEKAEYDLKNTVAKDSDLNKEYGSAWDDIVQAQKLKAEVYSKIFIARQLINTSNLASDTPAEKEFKKAKLADLLSFAAETFGYNDTFVKNILANRSPQERTNELLSDPAFSGLIRTSIRQDAIAYNQILQIEQESYTKIAQAMFELKGADIYPDATFTLRLTFGIVKGYKENGADVSYCTTFGGAFGHAAKHGNKKPWQLPDSWFKKATKINLNTPLNFVSTVDITGGNSGSPVINRNGEVVGLIFDSNIHGLANDLLYTEEQARAVSVSSQAIIEALRKIYNAKFLAEEVGR